MGSQQSLVCVSVALSMTAAFSSEFINLGFDEGDLSGAPFYGDFTKSGTGHIGAVFPGWTVAYGTNQPLRDIDINLVPDFIGTLVSLNSNPKANPDVISGRFALLLTRGDTNEPLWRMEQTGTIPAGTQFLSYRAALGVMELRIDDESLSAISGRVTPASATNVIYDVSKYAGAEVKLSLYGPLPPQESVSFPLDQGVQAWMDSVTFVSNPPSLTAQLDGTNVVVSWPASTQGLVLQSRGAVGPTSTWVRVLRAPIKVGTQWNQVVEAGAGAQFYRLGL